MKNLSIIGAVALLTTLFAQHHAQAQGTLYVSSFGQSSGSAGVASNAWRAQEIFTGSNSGGYSLDSIQLSVAQASGSPSDFAVMLYSSAGYAGPLPATSLGTLSGSASPSMAGIYTYTPGAQITLAPSTAYYIVMTAGTAFLDGAYSLDMNAGPYSTSDGWGEALFLRSPVGNSAWFLDSQVLGVAQLAIYATPVPEPSTLALLFWASLFLVWHRRKAKQA